MGLYLNIKLISNLFAFTFFCKYFLVHKKCNR